MKKNIADKIKELPEKIWEINHHYSKGKFTNCSVTPVTVLENGIRDKFSIRAQDSNGEIFIGNIHDYFLTEKEAIQQALTECEEKLKKEII